MWTRFSLAILLIAGTILLRGEASVQRLQDVKTVYIAPLDGNNVEFASLLTSKLISYLAKRGGVSVVESEAQADAVLIASYNFQRFQNEYGHTRYRGSGTVRLDSKEGLVLWADDASSGLFGNSASSSFADNVAKKVAQALAASHDKR
jgi:hypothetical protein